MGDTYIRCAVPQRDHLMGVITHWNAKGLRQTKVSKLQLPFHVDQQVLRLEVAVQDTVFVTVSNTLEKLIQEGLAHTATNKHTEPRCDSRYINKCELPLSSTCICGTTTRDTSTLTKRSDER